MKNNKIDKKFVNFFLLILEGILNILAKNLVKIQAIFKIEGSPNATTISPVQFL